VHQKTTEMFKIIMTEEHIYSVYKFGLA